MKEPEFVGYEYQDKMVKRSIASIYKDGYENFGWKLDEISEPAGRLDTIAMKFKRDRKIPNKAELTRLQWKFDAGMSEILSMECAKHTRASITAFTIGIIGTAFMAGAVFSVTANLILPCILFAVPAFIGWILPYFLYRKIERRKTDEMTPLIDSKYEELYAVCERAHQLPA